MQHELYPADWDEIARTVKDAAAWQCQGCGQQCRRPGERFDTHRRTLTVAHFDHEPSAAVVFVVALCAPCHLRYDSPRKAAQRRRKHA